MKIGLNDKIEFIGKDYDDEEWDNLTMEEIK
jgi:hypothetical protein